MQSLSHLSLCLCLHDARVVVQQERVRVPTGISCQQCLATPRDLLLLSFAAEFILLHACMLRAAARERERCAVCSVLRYTLRHLRGLQHCYHNDASSTSRMLLFCAFPRRRLVMSPGAIQLRPAAAHASSSSIASCSLIFSSSSPLAQPAGPFSCMSFHPHLQ